MNMKQFSKNDLINDIDDIFIKSWIKKQLYFQPDINIIKDTCILNHNQIFQLLIELDFNYKVLNFLNNDDIYKKFQNNLENFLTLFNQNLSENFNFPIYNNISYLKNIRIHKKVWSNCVLLTNDGWHNLPYWYIHIDKTVLFQSTKINNDSTIQAVPENKAIIKNISYEEFVQILYFALKNQKCSVRELKKVFDDNVYPLSQRKVYALYNILIDDKILILGNNKFYKDDEKIINVEMNDLLKNEEIKKIYESTVS